MDDAQRLAGYVEIWKRSVDDFLTLLETVPTELWATPTDLPGWDVHAVVAHTAHLEAILAGAPEETVDVGRPEHARGVMGLYTEQGVLARRDHTARQLIEEIRTSTDTRHQRLVENPPTDPAAKPEPIFGGVGWPMETLLRNRPLDVWMHDQDVRRAINLPGGMDSPAAQHTIDYLLASLGVVVGKRVAPPAGTSVLLEVDGCEPVGVEVGEDGRARPMEAGTTPTAALRLSRPDFVVLAGGRRTPEQVMVDGDLDLADAVVAALAVTP